MTKSHKAQGIAAGYPLFTDKGSASFSTLPWPFTGAPSSVLRATFPSIPIHINVNVMFGLRRLRFECRVQARQTNGRVLCLLGFNLVHRSEPVGGLCLGPLRLLYNLRRPLWLKVVQPSKSSTSIPKRALCRPSPPRVNPSILSSCLVTLELEVLPLEGRWGC